MIYTVIVSDGYVRLEQDHASLYQATRHMDRLIESGFDVEVQMFECIESQGTVCPVPVLSLVYNPI